MIRRHLLLGTLAAVIALTAGAASAGEIRAFDREAFEAAQRDAKPILVEITAPWCSVCRAQKPIIQALAQNPEFGELEIFTVDFDSQKDVVRALDARSQSTLIVFRGGVETGRSVGDTDRGRIESLVATAFSS